jgi:hypothetical protein
MHEVDRVVVANNKIYIFFIVYSFGDISTLHIIVCFIAWITMIVHVIKRNGRSISYLSANNVELKGV